MLLAWLWWLRRDARRARFATVRWFAVVGIVGFLVASWWSTLRRHRGDGVRVELWPLVRDSADVGVASARLEAVAIAVVMVTVGAAAVVLAVPAIRQGWSRAAVLGVVAAVAVSGVVAGAVLRYGDDSRYFSVDTANDAAAPPIPATLGSQRFSVRLGDEPGKDPTGHQRYPKYSTFAAGASFVVWDQEAQRVTAYDSSGAERWHFRQRAPGTSLDGVTEFDSGRTLMLYLTAKSAGTPSPALVAFDATTGRRLWSGWGDALIDAFVPVAKSESRYLVVREANWWTYFDSRTGERRWRVPNPTACSGPTKPLRTHRVDDEEDPTLWFVDSPTTLGAVKDCSTVDRIVLRVVVVDPASGQVVHDVVAVDSSRPPDDRMHFSAGQFGKLALIEAPTSPPSHRLVDLNSGAVTPTDGDGILGSTPRGDVLIATDYNPLRLFVGDADGRRRCTVVTQGNGGQVAGLADEFVMPMSLTGAGNGLLVFDVATCRATERPAPTDTIYVLHAIAAPGVTVVERTDPTGVYLDGYAP